MALDLPDVRVPDDMSPEEMPDLLRYWYLGTRARQHMMLKRFARVDAEIAEERFRRILDIGSAWGYNVLVLARLGKTAVGMDLVPDQFGAGLRVARANDLDLPVIGADASCLPFAPGEFDGITMVETFEHIFDADREKTVAECLRVLRTGGVSCCRPPTMGASSRGSSAAPSASPGSSAGSRPCAIRPRRSAVPNITHIATIARTGPPPSRRSSSAAVSRY